MQAPVRSQVHDQPRGCVTETTTPDGTVTKTPRTTFKQNWRAYTVAQCEEKDRFMELLSELCSTLPQPPQTMGRPRLPLSEMTFSAVFKVYSGFSARRFTCDLGVAQERGFVTKVPSFATVNNYLAGERMTAVLKDFIATSALPLRSLEQDFAVDSSGFGTSRLIKWFDKRWGKQVDAREWVKVHLMVGARTQIVTNVEIAGWETNDNPYFAPLVNATARDWQIGDVMADKGYLSRSNLQVVSSHGGTPYVPFKSSTIEPKENGSTWTKMYHLFAYQRDGWLQHYNRRQCVESAFARVKGKFGDAVRGKTNTAQVNEVLAKVLCHNICVVIRAMQEFEVEPEYAIA